VVPTIDLVRRAVKQLSSWQRQIVVGVYYRDRSIAEIAFELGIPQGAVKSRTHNAMRELHRIMNGEQRSLRPKPRSVDKVGSL
jgi:RNA polymerase sigma-70 factor, ECF subfamily